MDKNLDKMIDISVTLSKDTVVYPENPQPSFYYSSEMSKGDFANVGHMEVGLHFGTHVDAPWHFVNSAKKLGEMPLSRWVGPCLVVDATHEEKCVTAQALKHVDLDKHKRILFKTKNSLDYYKRPEFYHDFIYLDKSVCELMAANDVLTVGLDYITVDPFGSPNYPAHKTLFNNNICVIECIDLDHVEAGEYYLMCLPLKFADTDGGNARIFLLESGFCV